LLQFPCQSKIDVWDYRLFSGRHQMQEFNFEHQVQQKNLKMKTSQSFKSHRDGLTGFTVIIGVVGVATGVTAGVTFGTIGAATETPLPVEAPCADEVATAEVLTFDAPEFVEPCDAP
jgi:hypothetical protein